MSEVELKGWDGLMANLDAIPARAAKNILRGMVRDAAVTVAEAAKEKAPVLQPGTKNPHERYPGELRDSIIAVGVRAPPGRVVAGVRIRTKRDQLQETKKGVKALHKGKLEAAARALQAGIANGYWWRWVEFGSAHNQPPRPFMRQAWDGVKEGLLGQMADYCRARLRKLTED